MLERKLRLVEDDEEVIQHADEPKEEPKAEVLSASNLLNSLIKGEWDAIDLYNSMVITFEGMGVKQEVIDAIKDITEEEYVHVGQLEKLLQDMNGSANEIEAGKDEAEEQLGGSFEGEIK